MTDTRKDTLLDEAADVFGVSTWPFEVSEDPLWAWDGHVNAVILPKLDAAGCLLKAMKADLEAAEHINGRHDTIYNTVARAGRDRALEVARLLVEAADRYQVLEKTDYSVRGSHRQQDKEAAV